MKYIVLFILFFLQTMAMYAQSYEEMMIFQKSLIAGKDNYSISIDQEVKKNSKIDPILSYKTEIFGSKGRMFWKTPVISILQNERVCLMIRESDKLIMYKKFDQTLNLDETMKLGMQEWDASLKKFLEIAKTINSKEEGNSLIFNITTDSEQVANVVIKFDAKSKFMNSISFDQIDQDGEVMNMKYVFQYKFGNENYDIFDEKNIVSAGVNPKGIGEYQGYDVLLNTM